MALRNGIETLVYALSGLNGGVTYRSVKNVTLQLLKIFQHQKVTAI